MSVDIYDMFRGLVIEKMEREELFDVEIPEDYDDYKFNHPNYKAVEDAMYQIVSGDENDNYTGINAEFMNMADALAERAVALIEQRIADNEDNSFDPMI